MIRMTPGAKPVSYGGVDGYGHPGIPPDTVFEGPDLAAGRPAVVVASGYFPGIGVDEVAGLEGVAGTNIVVGDYDWRIAAAARASEDGAEVLLMLTHPV